MNRETLLAVKHSLFIHWAFLAQTRGQKIYARQPVVDERNTVITLWFFILIKIK